MELIEPTIIIIFYILCILQYGRKSKTFFAKVFLPPSFFIKIKNDTTNNKHAERQDFIPSDDLFSGHKMPF